MRTVSSTSEIDTPLSIRISFALLMLASLQKNLPNFCLTSGAKSFLSPIVTLPDFINSPSVSNELRKAEKSKSNSDVCILSSLSVSGKIFFKGFSSFSVRPRHSVSSSITSVVLVSLIELALPVVQSLYSFNNLYNLVTLFQ